MTNVPVTASADLLDALEQVYGPRIAAEFQKAGMFIGVPVDVNVGEDGGAFTRALATPVDVRQFASYFLEAGEKYGLAPVLLWSIMIAESYGQPLATRKNDSGKPVDFGLMQVNIVANKAWLDEKMPDGTPKWQDPRENILKGAEILRNKFRVLTSLTSLAPYDLTVASVAAYNAGEGTILGQLRSGQTLDPKGYAAAVLSRAAAKAATILEAGADLSPRTAELALILASGNTPATAALRKAYDADCAAARCRRLSATSRKKLYDVGRAEKVRAGAELAKQAGDAKQAVPVLETPKPETVRDANLLATTYDYEKGIWGDGAMT